MHSDYTNFTITLGEKISTTGKRESPSLVLERQKRKHEHTIE